MDTFGERTLCLLSPAISSITASTFLPGSTSRGSRSRTRMGTSMERNFYTFILFSLALVILILSPSASANRCIPTFSLLSNGEGMEYGNNVSAIDEVRTHVTVREQASYKLNCSLSAYHSVKWTINSREITPQLQDEWDIDIESGEEMDGSLYTELRVNNASQKHHAGEYRCTPVCMSVTSGTNNIGVTVSINIAINVTISVDTPARMGISIAQDSAGNSIYRINVQREKGIEIKCKAPVPNAQMTWYRIKDDNREENMADVCVGHDVELAHKTKRKTRQQHCAITHSSSGEQSAITLNIRRARKEGNEELKTIPDFRKYVCKAMKEGNQDGHATVELVETIQAERKFVRGERSVSVIEGNELEIYCDIHGVDKSEFETGMAKLEWHKDGQKLVVEELKNAKKIAEIGPADTGRPYRVGFSYDMAEPEHRGQYKCELIRPSAPDHDASNSTRVYFDYYVRVKDKLGALWPFLGICAEVVILCTIILIYEKRRNKQELDESDTDGSPDQ